MSKKNGIKKLLTLCLITSVLATNTFAAPAQECQTLIDAADKALAAQKQQIEIRDLRIKMVEDRLGEVRVERDDERKAGEAWYRSPNLWLFIGIGLGVSMVRVVN